MSDQQKCKNEVESQPSRSEQALKEQLGPGEPALTGQPGGVETSSSDQKETVSEEKQLLNEFITNVRILMRLSNSFEEHLKLPDPIYPGCTDDTKKFYWGQWHKTRNMLVDYFDSGRELDESFKLVKYLIHELNKLDYFLEFQVPRYEEYNPRSVEFVEDDPRKSLELMMNVIRLVESKIDKLSPNTCSAPGYAASITSNNTVETSIGSIKTQGFKTTRLKRNAAILRKLLNTEGSVKKNAILADPQVGCEFEK